MNPRIARMEIRHSASTRIALALSTTEDRERWRLAWRLARIDTGNAARLREAIRDRAEEER